MTERRVIALRHRLVVQKNQQADMVSADTKSETAQQTTPMLWCRDWQDTNKT